MSMTANGSISTRVVAIRPSRLRPSCFSTSIYGDPAPAKTDDLLQSIRDHGILVPLVVQREPVGEVWQVISGHRRLECALALGLTEVPCEIRSFPTEAARRVAILEYNHQRHKSYSQLMREADALEELWAKQAKRRRLANLRGREFGEEPSFQTTDRRNSDDRWTFKNPNGDGAQRGEKQHGRTDVRIAQRLGFGGKDLYRQARAVWQFAQAGDARAKSGVAQLDAGTKTIHAAYKDLRRRSRFSADFRPTPYDVWAFRHDTAFGVAHPGSIPAAIIAHTLYYFTAPDALVVDPMAGGGSTLDVCQSMGRRCLAYDIQPVRPDIHLHDVRRGFPAEAGNCDLVFCDPPYHTMLARQYSCDGIATSSFSAWKIFLHDLAKSAFATLRPGGFLALLLAAQTEKDLPAGVGYLDHAFIGYSAALQVGFEPERRISCPMEGAYLPQQVRNARREGRLLGQVRDLLILRKPHCNNEITAKPPIGL